LMDDLVVTPCAPLRGDLVLAHLPGDKSISHRALLLAVLTPGTTVLRRLNRALAVEELIRALRQLGCLIGERGETVIVSEATSRIRESCVRCPELDLGGSSTAARLLIGLLAGLSVDAIVTGDPSLRARPMDWIVEPLREMGAAIEYLDRPRQLPIRLKRSPLRGGEVAMRVTSAQASSAVILAAVAAGVRTRVVRRRGSRDHTERLLRALGATISETDDAVEIGEGKLAAMPEYSIPIDPSAAAYPVAAHVLLRREGRLSIRNVAVNPARRGLFDLLKAMGAAVTVTEEAIAHGEPIGSVEAETQDRPLGAFRLGGRKTIHSMIDELPLAAGLAACAEGRSTIRNAEELTFKETNRLTTTAALLSSLGVPAQACHDGCNIDGSLLRVSGALQSFGDHRIAMTAATLATIVKAPVRIVEGACFQTSFPTFIDAMCAIGCDMRIGSGGEEG
jgi:3-phosphoshikimate 1-carboxyvinyltransferase